MRLGVQTVVRKRAGAVAGRDQYGDPIVSAPDELAIPGCSVQPGGGSEQYDRRDVTTTLYSVWAPADADVVETDIVNHEGIDYAVDGAVERWNANPRMAYKMIRLKAVNG